MKEKVISTIDELVRALEDGYTNFYTKGFINHSFHITFGNKEGIYEVDDLADDLIICMDAQEVLEWFEDDFNKGTFIAED